MQSTFKINYQYGKQRSDQYVIRDSEYDGTLDQGVVIKWYIGICSRYIGGGGIVCGKKHIREWMVACVQGEEFDDNGHCFVRYMFCYGSLLCQKESGEKWVVVQI